MNTPDYKEFLATLVRDLGRIEWTNPCAVTLTLKLSISSAGVRTSLDAIKASENLRHFLNRLNRAAFGRGWKRRDRGLTCVPIYEGSTSVRPHYHLCIDRPDHIELDDFASAIRTHWSETHWGYSQVNVQTCDEVKGWLRYITKPRTKIDYANSIDWINYQKRC